MEEPSVLDYIKAKLTFWKPSNITIPPPEPEVDSLLAVTNPTIQSAPGGVIEVAPLETKKPLVAAGSATGILMVLGGLALALIAQSFLEPPNRAGTAAGVLYAFAALLVGSAYLRNWIAPAAIPEEMVTEENFHVHPEGLVMGLVLMLLTFATFSMPRGMEVPVFNFINTALWLLSVAYLVWAFYIPRSGGLPGVRERIRRFLAQPNWKITLTRWSVLLLLVIGVVLFFRFYRLNSLPQEAVSDHAEKLLDVNDVLHGQLRVFFPRNTGREAFQFYWTVLMIKLFNTGVTFFSLKLGTTLIGLLTLFYMYRIGKEIGNRWVGLLAVLFTGFSYWANIQSRIGLRFPLYPGFYAPMLFYLLRGLRTSNRNDFLWAGLWMGIGLQGYTSYRIVPLVAVAAFLIYWLHHNGKQARRFAFEGLFIVALLSLATFMPLFRFITQRPDLVAFRSLTRLGSLERPLPGSPVGIFFSNSWNALMMFFWGNGDVWVHSIPNRPALDVISAALFFLGVVLITLRYIRKRSWVDLFMLISIPLLLLPSILSLAFPNENPNLNRTAAAYVPAFLILAIGLEGLLSSLIRNIPGRVGLTAAIGLGLFLTGLSAQANYDLVFNQYDVSARGSALNSSEMASVVKQFANTMGRLEDAWVVPYPYWVDTRLVGIGAGDPTRDMALNPDQLPNTQSDPRNKLFILNPQDNADLAQLASIYPQGRYWTYTSRTPGKDFIVFLVLADQNMLREGPAGSQ